MSEIKYGYYYGDEAEQFTFYRIPKLLMKGEQFKDVTIESKILYGLLLDRMSLSIRKDIPGYAITGWTLKTTNKSVEKTGMEIPVEVHLTNSENVKYLIVNCLSLDDEDDDPIPPPTIIVKPTGDCDGIIEWTETDSHRVLTGYNSKGKAIYKTCSHTFTYRTTLTANAKISPDKFKSGYGFELEVPYSISTKLISNNGGCSSWGKSRSATASVSKPTKATVYIPWNKYQECFLKNENDITIITNRGE